MSISTIDKIRKLRASRPTRGGGSKLKGIFHAWKDGDNIIRLQGPFLETKTHFIAPAPKRSERGLCQASAFQGEDKIPQVINCLNWDIQNEEEKVGGCPICRLGDLAHQVLKEGCPEEEKKIFEKLRRDCNPRTQLKWNILDRDNPFVLSVDNGQESQVLGYKIASIGMEAWGDIEGIFDQMGFDISDTEEGLDICVNRGHNGTRISYSAQACIDTSVRPPAAKITPLSDEERALTPNELKVICGKYVEVSRIMDALHEDYLEMLDINTAPEEVAPASISINTESDMKADSVESAAAKRAISEDDDDDGLMGGTAPSKTSRTPVKN